jgi:hypothetical protein
VWHQHRGYYKDSMTLDTSAQLICHLLFYKLSLSLNAESSRLFIFDNQVFQFARIPYGLRSSLPGFIRALNMTYELGVSAWNLVQVFVFKRSILNLV